MNRNLLKLAVNFVDDPIISDSKPVEPFSAMEFEYGRLRNEGWRGDLFRPMFVAETISGHAVAAAFSSQQR